MAKSKQTPFNGWLLLDKPQGITSNSALQRVRHQFGRAKAGYVGTLDPLATGVLPIALGEATKTIPYLENTSKTYAFTVRWGIATDSADSDGQVIKEGGSVPIAAAIEAALPRFVGEIQQTPPAYSALKINGVPAYKLARAGEEVQMKPRTAHIYALHLTDSTQEGYASFSVQCGKGTYVRTLAEDIAATLGTLAHVVQLRRTAVGRFGENMLKTLEAVTEATSSADAPLEALAALLFDPSLALDGIPALEGNEQQARQAWRGQVVALPRGLPPSPAWLKFSGKVVAIGSIEAGGFHPERALRY
jgi:tRNA pseudouridine55 synthase